MNVCEGEKAEWVKQQTMNLRQRLETAALSESQNLLLALKSLSSVYHGLKGYVKSFQKKSGKSEDMN